MRRGLTRRQWILAALPGSGEEIIDIHCHPPIPTLHNESWILEHQRLHGVKTSVLLPVNSAAGISSPLFPKFTIGQSSAREMARKHPGEFLFFANADPRARGAAASLEKNLRAGARGIGEVKLPLACDSPHMELLYSVARDFSVPVLIHFEHARFATGFERFSKVLEKYHTVTFIGHAQTWWGNIDRLHQPENLYPASRVSPGGLTDRLLSGYPNIYADLSAASGFQALDRDHSHARDFLERHRDRLLFGSDCEHADAARGDRCWCGLTLALLRSLASPAALPNILHATARRLLKLPLTARSTACSSSTVPA